MRDFGSAIEGTLLEVRLCLPRWAHRGDPCGLLLGVDEPLGYDNEPPEFRPFCSWGVDGVYDGLWIDWLNQPHPPFFVLFSPMDFDEPVLLLASSIDDWLGVVTGDETGSAAGLANARERATTERRRRRLPEVGIGSL